MNTEPKAKEMITQYLDRIGIVARVGVEDGEFTKEEILRYISDYGNAKIDGTLDMSDSDFALLAMTELFKASLEMVKGR